VQGGGVLSPLCIRLPVHHTLSLQALERLRASALHGHCDRCWPDVVGWNHKLYLGLSQFHASFEHADAYEYGPQVAIPYE
jgi:hypothetical protein